MCLMRAATSSRTEQWGRAMQDDIVDPVDVIVRSGVADRSRMARRKDANSWK
jgi:hypothetical protein